jgi:hypothetical protein
MKIVSEVFVENFAKSFREHPSLTLFVILICCGVLGYSVRSFAEKVDLNNHITESNTRFLALERKIEKMDFGILSRTLEAEIFELERIIERKEAREIDHIRLRKLKSRLKSAERNISEKRAGS